MDLYGNKPKIKEMKTSLSMYNCAFEAGIEIHDL